MLDPRQTLSPTSVRSGSSTPVNTAPQAPSMVPGSALSKQVASPTVSQSMSPNLPHSRMNPSDRMAEIRRKHEQKQMRGQPKVASPKDHPSDSSEIILKDQLHQQSLEIDELKKERDATSARLKAIEDHIAARKPNAEIEEKIAGVSARVNKLEAEPKTQSTSSEDDLSKLQSEIAQLLSWKASRTDTDGALCATRNHVRSELKTLETRVDNQMRDMSNRLDKLTVSNGHPPNSSDLPKQVKNLSKDIDDLTGMVNDLAKRTRGMEEKQRVLDDKHRGLDKALRRAEDDIDQLFPKVEALEEHKKKWAQKETTMKQLSGDQSRLSVRLDKLQQETVALSDRLSDFATSSRLDLLETQVTAVAGLTTTIKYVEEETKTLSEGQTDFEQRLSEVQGSLADLKSAHVLESTAIHPVTVQASRTFDSVPDLSDGITGHNLQKDLKSLHREVDQQKEDIKALFENLEQTDRDVHDVKVLKSLEQSIPKICKEDAEKIFDLFKQEYKQEVDSLRSKQEMMYLTLQSQSGLSKKPDDAPQHKTLHDLQTLLQQQIDANNQRIRDLALNLEKAARTSQSQEIHHLRTSLSQELVAQGQKIADLAIRVETPATSSQISGLRAETMALSQVTAALQQELATQRHQTQDIMHQLGLKANNADVIQNMNRYTHSFKALQDRYDNIYTDDLHMKMVYWFLQQFPNNNASLMDKMRTMSSDLVELKQVSRKLSQLDVAKLISYTPHLDNLQRLPADHAAVQEALKIANIASTSATQSSASVQNLTEMIDDYLSKIDTRVKDIGEELGTIKRDHIDPNKEFFMILIPAIVSVGQLQTTIRKIDRYIRDQSRGRDKVEIFNKWTFDIEHMLQNRNPGSNNGNPSDVPNGPPNQ